ncbi:MAG TPA: ComEA family DNA-binding protein [Haloplasmataceae bacterium]
MINFENNKKWFIFLIITNLISIGILLFVIFKPHEDNLVLENDKIYVQIVGEIINPDVYEIEKGLRLKDLIEIAGGLTDEADELAINLALLLEDEMKITIPAINSDDPMDRVNGKININTADLTLLMSLNGIGEVKAKAIIEYREKNGPFKTIEQIMRVTGIGQKTYEKIKDCIYC